MREDSEVVHYLAISPETMSDLQEATRSDQIMNELKKAILDGWRAEEAATTTAQTRYFGVRAELSVLDELVYIGECVVVSFWQETDDIRTDSVISYRHILLCEMGKGQFVLALMTTAVKDKVNTCVTCRQYGQKQEKETFATRDTAETEGKSSSRSCHVS